MGRSKGGNVASRIEAEDGETDTRGLLALVLAQAGGTEAVQEGVVETVHLSNSFGILSRVGEAIDGGPTGNLRRVQSLSPRRGSPARELRQQDFQVMQEELTQRLEHSRSLESWGKGAVEDTLTAERRLEIVGEPEIGRAHV